MLFRSYLGEHTQFFIMCDSAFKKEDDSGHALKGHLVLRRPVSAEPCVGEARGTKPSVGAVLRSGKVHLVDFLSKKVSNVTRSTFSSELFGACDAADHGLLLRQIVHEFEAGPLTASQARDLREGKLTSKIKIDIGIDAMSVYAAVTAAHIKIPAEKALLGHLQFLRELLDKGVINALYWVDTRDMVADGMTKGSVARDAILRAMSGSIIVSHAVKEWSPLVRQLDNPSLTPQSSSTLPPSQVLAVAEPCVGEASGERTRVGEFSDATQIC